MSKVKTRKTRLVIEWADGSRHEMVKRDGAWWWSETAGSFPLSAAIQNVEDRGGRVRREPVPQAKRHHGLMLG